MTRQLTAIISKEKDMYVALCPEVDIASQGYSYEEAKANLTEALELYFEVLGEDELATVLQSDIAVTQINVELPHAV